MRKTVVHLVYSFGIGGLERVIANLVNSTDVNEVEHVIITQVPEQSFADRLTAPVTFLCLDKQDGKDFGSHWRLFKMLRELKPDVFHTYNFGTLEYQTIAWLARVPRRVHADHGRESSYKKITNPATYENFRRAVAPFLNYYVVVSYDLHSWAAERLKLKADKLRLVFNGIDLEQFGVAAPSPSEHYDFITIGRLVDVKNHQLLVRALSKACQLDSGFRSLRLMVVGDGPNMDDLRALAVELGVQENITFAGPRDDIPQLLAQSDVFVLPSKYEAQPMTALEAMASQLPVVATNVGGVSYVVEDNQNGILVEPDNVEALARALIRTRQEPDDAKSMGKEGRRLVEEKFSVQAMRDHYLSLYGISA